MGEPEKTTDPPIRILRVGDGWLAVEKPAGISIHNDPGRDLRSLLAARVFGDERLFARIDADRTYGFHAVGRLDKEADGLVLAAWRPAVFAALAAQYAGRETHKTYAVLLHGRLKTGSDPAADLVWTRPLSKDAGGRRSPAGNPPRMDCQTTVRVLRHAGQFTLVECRPLTGRKHQIRRHAALAGHPVAGDRRYGPVDAADRLRRRYGFDRIALHAAALSFRPPGSPEPITIETGGLPASFTALLDAGEATGSD